MATIEVTLKVGNDGVAVITISNPPVNALSIQIITGLKQKFEEATWRTDVKAIVLTGKGGRFSGGFDINVFDKVHKIQHVHRSNMILVDWFKVDKPFDSVALYPKCLVQIPAKPNYSLVMYYASKRPVTCRYCRQDNFLEINVDIGSSSVARSVIELVLGYVTSIVVDLAILIEAKEESELPEYILGNVRLNCLNPDGVLFYK